MTVFSPRTREVPSVDVTILRNSDRCSICKHDGVHYEINCCPRGKRWVCHEENCRGQICQFCSKPPGSHARSLTDSSDSEIDTGNTAIPDITCLHPQRKVLILLDQNGTLGCEYRNKIATEEKVAELKANGKDGPNDFSEEDWIELNGTSFTTLEGATVEGSDLNKNIGYGFRGFAAKWYHRRFSDTLVKFLVANHTHFDFGFWTTKVRRNAIALARAILEHAMGQNVTLHAIGDDEGQDLAVSVDFVAKALNDRLVSFKLFCQAFCSLSEVGGYQFGDKGGRWVFDMLKLRSHFARDQEDSYKQIFVIAGSKLKLSMLETRHRLPCSDYTAALVQEGTENGLHEVLLNLRGILLLHQFTYFLQQFLSYRDGLDALQVLTTWKRLAEISEANQLFLLNVASSFSH